MAVLLVMFLAVAAGAQTTLSTLAGRVTADGAGLAGVTVSVNSPALQGQRSAVTGPDGDYVLPALPPGDYLITFTLAGMQQAVQRAQLRLSETTRVDAAMRQQAVNEEITVRPAEQTVLETPQVSTNIDAATLEYLPTTRGILDFAKLAPGVVEINTMGQRGLIAISGAQPYDNLFMVNGVTITDRRTNQPLSLYIEDAIQEATVMTAGISAEYGRFIGGVVNVLTRSGGNTFSGSLRDTISSNAWTAKTPYPGELDHLDEIDHELQGTLGGSVVRDRLWFFLAGRDVGKSFARQTRATALAYINETAEHRYEGKLTANISQSHSLVGSYLNVSSTGKNEGPSADFRGMFHRDQASSLGALHYTGIYGRSTVVEGQFGTKQRSFRALPTTPGIDDSFVSGTTINDLGPGGSMWAPVLCVVCGSDDGHGRNLLLKASRFTPTRRFGTHELVVGADEYHDIGRSVGDTSSSGFIVYSQFVLNGTQIYPRFGPDVTTIYYYDVPPLERSDFRTRSLFVNDQIGIGSRLSATIGFRFDENHGQDVDGDVVVNDSRLAPRLGLTYDLRGDGRHRFSASFGRYSSKALENPLEPATAASSPTIYEWAYDGPEISGLPAEGAMRQLYAWFQARGGLEDVSDALVFTTLGYKIGKRLTSPATDEYTVGYGRQFGAAGMAQVHYVNRHSFDYYTVHQTLATQENGHDLIVVDNNTDGAVREYEAIALQARWRRRRFNIAGNYTWSKLRGNVEQESNGNPVAEPSGKDWYPEYSQYPQFKPIGWLNNDMRHVANVWAGYDFSTERTHINVSVLQRFHTGRNYNARATINLRSIPNPGYEFPPPALQYYFRPRGGQRLPDITSTGVALNAARKFGMVELLAQLDVTNVFNEDEIEHPGGIDTSVITNLRDRNLAPFNPVTTTPVECPAGVASSSPQCRNVAHYRLSPTYGKPISASAYQQPRTYNVSFGARF